MTLNLPFGIFPLNALSNIDERYGPYNSLNDALLATSGTRNLGLTVAIIENGIPVEYWFRDGILDNNLVTKLGSTQVIDVNDIEIYDPLKPNDPISGFAYEAGNVFISYVNIGSLDEMFQSAAIYRCANDTLTGVSPEDSLYDIISNPTGSWEYQGQQIEISTNTGATVYASSTNVLRTITGYKSGDHIFVGSLGRIYRYSSTIESGIKPNNGTVGSGSWVVNGYFSPSYLSWILNPDENGSEIILPPHFTILTTYGPGYIEIIDENNILQCTLNFDSPSSIKRINTGYDPITSFIITPFIDNSYIDLGLPLVDNGTVSGTRIDIPIDREFLEYTFGASVTTQTIGAIPTFNATTSKPTIVRLDNSSNSNNITITFDQVLWTWEGMKTPTQLDANSVYILRIENAYFNSISRVIARLTKIGESPSGGGELWTTTHIDSGIISTITAQEWTEYIIDGSSNPVTINLPDTPFVGRIRALLDKDTHKVIITTPSRITLIRGAVEQIIATIGATIEIVGSVDHYDIVLDTNNLSTVEVLTASRDFSDGDGLENNIWYDCDPQGDSHIHLLPAAKIIPGNKAIISGFSLLSDGTVTITDGLLFNETLNIIGTSFQIKESSGVYTILNDTRPKILQTTLTTYSLDEDTDRIDAEWGQFYKARCTDSSDIRLGTAVETGVTVNVSSPNWTLLSSSITDRGILVGEIETGNINIYTTVRKASGVQDMNYQVRYYKVTNTGVETLIGTSNTILVQNTVAQQYLMAALHTTFSMTATDAIAVKTYAQRTTATGTPIFYSTIEGVNLTRSDISVPTSTITHNTLSGRDSINAHPASSITTSDSSTVQQKITDIEIQIAANSLTFAAIYGYYNFR